MREAGDYSIISLITDSVKTSSVYNIRITKYSNNHIRCCARVGTEFLTLFHHTKLKYIKCYWSLFRYSAMFYARGKNLMEKVLEGEYIYCFSAVSVIQPWIYVFFPVNFCLWYDPGLTMKLRLLNSMMFIFTIELYHLYVIFLHVFLSY